MSEGEEEEEEQPVFRRPRIVKPGEGPPRPQEEEEPQGKGIRGRRRPLYASKSAPAKPNIVRAPQPTARPVVRPSSSSPMKQPTPPSPKLPRATRASALRQNSSLGSRGTTDESRTPSAGSSAGSSPRLSPGGRGRPVRSKSLARPAETPSPMRRQNTFTKEQQAAAARMKVLRRDAVQPARTDPKGKPLGVAKSASLTRDAKPPSATELATWAEKPTPAKKEVTSRIASLWKKVEKAQAKPKDEKKDKKVWITRAKSGMAPSAAMTPKPALVRSSTYEKLSEAVHNGSAHKAPSEATPGKSKTRLGLKLAKLRGRDTRSSPPSEASTPLEPRPQCLVSPTRRSSAAPRVGGGAPDNTVVLRNRPVTHPQAGTTEDPSKRFSRLGSFIAVEEDGRSPPQSAIVPPFNYQPPANHPGGLRTPSTRIPQPSKYVSNAPSRDDNGNPDIAAWPK